MSRWFVLAMTYLNFLPLWLIVIGINLAETYSERVSWKSPVMIGCYALALLIVVCWIGMVINLRDVPYSCTKFRVTLNSCHEKKTECAELMLTYILPIIGLDLKSGSGLIQLAILFDVLASVYVRHFHWQTNIVLDWLGYLLYECVVTDENSKRIRTFVLVKGTLEGCRNRELVFYKMNSQLYLAVRGEEER